jgi:putative tryptophan/tyrosine transport system substrate-binding protein
MTLNRRNFIALLGGAAAAWPLVARAQQAAVPIVALVFVGSADDSAERIRKFAKGLGETGIVEGQNVRVEPQWLEGRYDRLPALMADLVRRQVAVIAAPGSTPSSIAAKAATATIPIVFGVAEDPVKLGLVASLARPGGNATGFNFLMQEVDAKRLGLLHELLPKATRIALLVNPSNRTSAASTTAELQEAAHALGLQVMIANASTNREIDAVFAEFTRQRPDALVVGADGFFVSRRVQLANLTARDRIPAVYSQRDFPVVGGLMSYGTDILDSYYQAGVYAGKIIKGAKPGDLPVVQSTKFELVINVQTSRLLGVEVPPTLLAIADEVIE